MRSLTWRVCGSLQPYPAPNASGGREPRTRACSICHPPVSRARAVGRQFDVDDFRRSRTCPRRAKGALRVTSTKTRRGSARVAERLLPSGFPVLETKLVPPPSRAGLLRRGVLIDRLSSSSEVPILAVLAPAGYGKSTVLAQWAESDPRQFAWLSIDDRDNDPAVLLSYIALALGGAAALGPDVAEALASPGPSVWSAAVPRLGAALAKRPQAFVLVLDDVDRLTESDSADVARCPREPPQEWISDRPGRSHRRPPADPAHPGRRPRRADRGERPPARRRRGRRAASGRRCRPPAGRRRGDQRDHGGLAGGALPDSALAPVARDRW